MSGDNEDDDLSDLLGPEPVSAEAIAAYMLMAPPENLVDETPKSRPMGEASRALLERSRSYPVNRAAKKNTPERLQRLLDYIAEMPITSDACKRASISVSTLKYWLQKSSEGRPGDGFDMALGLADENGGDENFVRFHDAWEAAMETGVGLVERSVHQRAIGYEEVLTYQGKVQYKIDPEKYDLYMLLGDPIDERNPDLWLRDARGIPVPETVWKMDPDLAMFVLKTRKPLVYGAKATMDVNIKGGVLVVPMRAVTSEDLNTIEAEYRMSEKQLVTFEEDDDEDPNLIADADAPNG